MIVYCFGFRSSIFFAGMAAPDRGVIWTRVKVKYVCFK